ncbi:MAG: hypothetical protein K0R39_3058 [Symbiobacteriaceae bacterium]|nr:hypothetical protein [Symbiobacteriaceae bacterium]
MANLHRPLTGVLTALLTLSLLAAPAKAAEPFAFITMLPVDGGVRLDGTTRVIPRNSPLRIEFSQPVDPATITRSISVTTSTGADAGWTAQPDWANACVWLQTSGTLPKNATYTVHIEGGAAGIKSTTGATLASDITVTLRTDETPVQKIVDISTQWGQSDLLQSEIYKLKVAAGPLRIVLNDLTEAQPMRVMLKSEATGEVILNEQYQAGQPSRGRDLPAGTYSLLLAPNVARAITLHGPDLDVSGLMPGLRFPGMGQWETRNQRFTLQPELLNAQATESLQVTLGKETLAQNLLRTDGTVAPLTIDPTTMEENIYLLTGVATARESGNQAIQASTFLVDRTDSFSDVAPNHWARRYIEIMHHIGVLNGRSAAQPGALPQFAPGQPVTRAEFAKMLALTLGLKPDPKSPAPFEDVPDDWSTPHIDALYAQGLIKGETVNGKVYYYPNRTIARAEAATIIGRLLTIADLDLDGETADFTDWNTIPDWARPSVVILAEMKWINGFPDGRYQPLQTLQRDQAARILTNFLGVK